MAFRLVEAIEDGAALRGYKALLILRIRVEILFEERGNERVNEGWVRVAL